MLMALVTSFSVKAQDDIFEQWKELDDFHMSIATIWHPAEEGEFEPIRSRPEELYNKASALKSSDIPEKYDTDEIRSAVGRLESGSHGIFISLREKNPSNEELFEELKSLHDVFHEIVGMCRDDEHSHDH
jgi:hypothetical protein